MARERGVDLRGVQGSGPKGRITSHDLMPTHEPRVIQDSAPAELDFAKWGAIEVKPLNTVRRLTALNLARSWSQVPQVTHYDSADVTELDELRSKLTEQLGQGKLKITITAILLKVVAAALKRMPQFNASLDLANNQVIYKKYIHIGVAVDTERGLLVPVIRDVEQKSILELAAELEDVSRRARDKKLPADEMRGATFTISNLGGIGGTNFSPIVNAPEVAILGVSRTQTQPRLMHGFFVPRLLLPLALSYDHRLIDGADAARFVRLLVDLIEQPALMAFDA
jgi:pyruvate dehydrogenase E2 component (dihydrolipoamide acetyltransferase)